MRVSVYYLVVGEEKKGPYTVGELRDLAAEGQLTTDDLLETSDGEGRIRAGLVVGIFGPALPEPIPSVAPETPESETSARRRFLWWAVGVVVVIPVLAFGLMAFSLLAIKRRDDQEKAESIANMKNLVRATLAYAADNDDRLPFMQPGIMEVRVKSYAGTGNLQSINPMKVGWATNEGISFERVGEIDRPDQTPLAFDITPRRDGTRIVGFVSGRVQEMVSIDFNDLWKETQKRQAARKRGGPIAGVPQPSPAP